MNISADSEAQLLKKLIEERAIFHSPEHLILSSSGEPQNWLIDLRSVFISSEGLDKFARLFWRLYEDKFPFQVGGMEVAAVPLVAAIVAYVGFRGQSINGFVIRKERKPYGLGKTIEGGLSDDPIILIDDIFNSGKSLEKARVALQEYGRIPYRVLAVVDYESARGQEWKDRTGIKIDTLFSLTEFGLKLAEARPPAYRLPFRTRWRCDAPGSNFFHVVPKSSPCAHDGRIYFGTDSGEMRCVDGQTGEIKWTFQIAGTHIKGIWSIPRVAANTVYFGGYDGNVYALDASSGKELWRNIEADWIGSSPALALDRGLLFIGREYAQAAAQGGLAALNLTTGATVWEFPTAEFLHGSPTYVPELGLVVVGTNEGTLLGVDAESGGIRWKFNAGGAIKHAPSIDLSARLAVFGAFDGVIRGVNLDDGALRLSVQTGDIVYTTPCLHDGLIYAGSADKHLYIIDSSTGHVQKKIRVNGKVFSSPRVFGNHVLFGSNDGCIYALNRTTQLIEGDLQLPDAITGSIEYDSLSQTFVALTTTNTLFGFSCKPLSASIGQAPIDITRRKITPAALAREAGAAFVSTGSTLSGAEFELDESALCGGVFVSIRDRVSLKRLARAGSWHFKSTERDVVADIIAATVEACVTAGISQIGEVVFAVAIFGLLEPVALGQLNFHTYGVVVCGRARRRIGGALPNSPEYLDEMGQYLHALKNAGLTLNDSHELYRHTVVKHVEAGSNWPKSGAPEQRVDVNLLGMPLASLAAMRVSQVSSQAAGKQSLTYPPFKPLPGLIGVAATIYKPDGIRTVFQGGATVGLAVREVLDHLETNDADSRVAPIVLSFLFAGTRMTGSVDDVASRVRVVRDALILVAGAQTHIALPFLACQHGHNARSAADRIWQAAGSPQSANWHVATCYSWLITHGAALPLRGGFVDATKFGMEYPARAWLLDLGHYVAGKIASMNKGGSIYLPVMDRQIAVADDGKQYITALTALYDAAEVVERHDWRREALTLLTAWLDAIIADPTQWYVKRQAILIACTFILCPESERNEFSELLARRGVGDLLEWAGQTPPASRDAADTLFTICWLARTSRHADDVGRLREHVSYVRAGLARNVVLDIAHIDIYAQAAVELIQIGERDLLAVLKSVAERIINWQLPESGIFVTTLGPLGPSADMARLLYVLSLTWAVLPENDKLRAPIQDAWRRGMMQLSKLALGDLDSFCLRNPMAAMYAVRDAEHSANASIVSSAKALIAVAHGCGCGLQPL